MDEMRRQNQQLKHRLERYKSQDNDDDDDENNSKISSSSNNEEDVNPFHHRPHHNASDRFSSRHQRKKIIEGFIKILM